MFRVDFIRVLVEVWYDLPALLFVTLDRECIALSERGKTVRVEVIVGNDFVPLIPNRGKVFIREFRETI